MPDSAPGDEDLTRTLPGLDHPSSPSDTGRLLGSEVGHIRIVRSLGQGGMGEVYEGFDQKLHRRVAIKTIRAEHRLSQSARARFLQEARLLSAQDHPNICRIYDYIEEADSDLLVLELIEGETLSQAIADATLTRRSKLGIALQIAEALAAAHHGGVIHRDLKPDNVMVTALEAELSVKVLDFGLAGSAGSGPESDEGEPDSAAVGETVGQALRQAELTQRGVVMGTLLYMSPEQARGELLTPASDMYSFGLVLQELFTGQKAYGAADREQIWGLAKRGESAAPRGLPADLTDLIQRLKRPQPAERLTALSTAQAVRRIIDKPKRIARNAIAAAVLLAAAIGVSKYGVDLARERTAAELARQQAEEVVEFLSEMLGAVNPTQELDARDITVRQVLDQASTRMDREFEEQPLVRARLRHTMGVAYQELGFYDQAGPLLEQSLEARRALLEDRHPDVTTSLAALARLRAKTGDYDKALELYEAVVAARERESPPTPLAVAHALNGLAGQLLLSGDYPRSRSLYERSLALYEHELPPDDPDISTVLNNLAGLSLRMRQPEVAIPLIERALSAQERTLGSDHLLVADNLNALGIANGQLGNHESAQQYFERALAIRERALGPDHDLVSSTVTNLAIGYRATGDYQRSRVYYERALAGLESSLGPAHVNVGMVQLNFANLLTEIEDFALAATHYRAAKAIFDQELGDHHPYAAEVLERWAELRRKLGEVRVAEQMETRAKAIRDRLAETD